MSTFILGSWICVAKSQGGSRSHLADTTELEANPPNASDDTAGLTDNLSIFQLFGLLEEQPSGRGTTFDDQKYTSLKKISIEKTFK